MLVYLAVESTVQLHASSLGVYGEYLGRHSRGVGRVSKSIKHTECYPIDSHVGTTYVNRFRNVLVRMTDMVAAFQAQC